MIWEACNGPNHLKSLKVEGFRISTPANSMHLSYSAESHDLLEMMLEGNKPPIEIGDYLIDSPFRYPPLLNSSRFGTRNERGVFYGSKDILCCMAEVSKNMFQFASDPKTPLPPFKVPEHVSFEFSLKTVRGVDLSKLPFDCYKKQLTSRASYADTQPLGQDMRAADVEACLFRSARYDGQNIAAFKPDILKRKPKTIWSWSCFVTTELVNFVCSARRESHQFNKQDLM